MTGPTHEDIMPRVNALEVRHEVSEHRLDSIERSIQTNQKASEQMELKLNDTHDQLIEHRAEVRGALNGLKFGGALVGAIITLGIAVIGIQVTN